ncbi:hypothetical protein H9I45_06395 [Polaribacter haliotis]|uniref:ParB/Sulfiredoxin domain-containing protein n=1 Tax=Polaribacter haliotis TaxID=1888915 RepID=A0A7L8AJ94_9FLAO|nr:hypothetical protein [Polaribacter haliotis]QOD62072.1 hypothetical protein H9I45_06395 [Polaribacter haliotis]
MYSINLKKPQVIISTGLTSYKNIYSHEEVLKDRKNALESYLKSYGGYFVLPSIICCSKTGLIIDGHHRYHTLVGLNVDLIPVTWIAYNDETIRTHNSKEKMLSKREILNVINTKKMLKPKSTLHEIQTIEDDWKPLILISSLFEINL